MVNEPYYDEENRVYDDGVVGVSKHSSTRTTNK